MFEGLRTGNSRLWTCQSRLAAPVIIFGIALLMVPVAWRCILKENAAQLMKLVALLLTSSRSFHCERKITCCGSFVYIKLMLVFPVQRLES